MSLFWKGEVFVSCSIFERFVVLKNIEKNIHYFKGKSLWVNI